MGRAPDRKDAGDRVGYFDDIRLPGDPVSGSRVEFSQWLNRVSAAASTEAEAPQRHDERRGVTVVDLTTAPARDFEAPSSSSSSSAEDDAFSFQRSSESSDSTSGSDAGHRRRFGSQSSTASSEGSASSTEEDDEIPRRTGQLDLGSSDEDERRRRRGRRAKRWRHRHMKPKIVDPPSRQELNVASAEAFRRRATQMTTRMMSRSRTFLAEVAADTGRVHSLRDGSDAPVPGEIVAGGARAMASAAKGAVVDFKLWNRFVTAANVEEFRRGSSAQQGQESRPEASSETSAMPSWSRTSVLPGSRNIASADPRLRLDTATVSGTVSGGRITYRPHAEREESARVEVSRDAGTRGHAQRPQSAPVRAVSPTRQQRPVSAGQGVDAFKSAPQEAAKRKRKARRKARRQRYLKQQQSLPAWARGRRAQEAAAARLSGGASSAVASKRQRRRDRAKQKATIAHHAGKYPYEHKFVVGTSSMAIAKAMDRAVAQTVESLVQTGVERKAHSLSKNDARSEAARRSVQRSYRMSNASGYSPPRVKESELTRELKEWREAFRHRTVSRRPSSATSVGYPDDTGLLGGVATVRPPRYPPMEAGDAGIYEDDSGDSDSDDDFMTPNPVVRTEARALHARAQKPIRPASGLARVTVAPDVDGHRPIDQRPMKQQLRRPTSAQPERSSRRESADDSREPERQVFWRRERHNPFGSPSRNRARPASAQPRLRSTGKAPRVQTPYGRTYDAVEKTNQVVASGVSSSVAAPTVASNARRRAVARMNKAPQKKKVVPVALASTGPVSLSDEQLAFMTEPRTIKPATYSHTVKDIVAAEVALTHGRHPGDPDVTILGGLRDPTESSPGADAQKTDGFRTRSELHADAAEVGNDAHVADDDDDVRNESGPETQRTGDPSRQESATSADAQSADSAMTPMVRHGERGSQSERPRWKPFRWRELDDQPRPRSAPRRHRPKSAPRRERPKSATVRSSRLDATRGAARSASPPRSRRRSSPIRPRRSVAQRGKAQSPQGRAVSPVRRLQSSPLRTGKRRVVRRRKRQSRSSRAPGGDDEVASTVRVAETPVATENGGHESPGGSVTTDTTQVAPATPSVAATPPTRRRPLETPVPRSRRKAAPAMELFRPTPSDRPVSDASRFAQAVLARPLMITVAGRRAGVDAVIEHNRKLAAARAAAAGAAPTSTASNSPLLITSPNPKLASPSAVSVAKNQPGADESARAGPAAREAGGMRAAAAGGDSQPGTSDDAYTTPGEGDSREEASDGGYSSDSAWVDDRALDQSISSEVHL